MELRVHAQYYYGVPWTPTLNHSMLVTKGWLTVIDPVSTWPISFCLHLTGPWVVHVVKKATLRRMCWCQVSSVLKHGTSRMDRCPEHHTNVGWLGFLLLERYPSSADASNLSASSKSTYTPLVGVAPCKGACTSNQSPPPIDLQLNPSR